MNIESYIYLMTQTSVPLLFLVFIIICEYIACTRKSKRFSFSHTMSNFGVLFVGVILFSLFDSFILARNDVLRYTSTHSLFSTPISWGFFFLWLIVFDFINYLTHILYHKSSFFWMFHSVHHSDKNLDSSTTIRVPIVSSFFTVTSYAFLSYFLGVNITLLPALAQTIFIQQILVHSFLLHKITPSFLSYIFITPNMHILHHTEKYNQRNYGFLFSFWDRIFKTGRFEKYNNETFGIPFTPETNNPFTIHKVPIIAFLRQKNLQDTTST